MSSGGDDDNVISSEEFDEDDSENISNTSESESSDDDVVDITKCDDITKCNGEDFLEYDQELLTRVHLNNFEDMIDEGMIYKSEDAAYDAYNEYARKIGFSIRKGNAYRRTDGSVRSRVFLCYKEGHRKPDRRNKNVRQQKRAEVRTGCRARMMIKPEEDGDWVVAAVSREHNHPLATPRKSYVLPSHRNLKVAHTGEINNLDAAGIPLVDGYDYMVEQSGGHANVGFTYLDYKNYLRKKQIATFGKGDATTILSYFTKKKAENSKFFYAVMVDEENQLTNLFWADATSIIDYSHFGDVIVFDTTYRTNKHRRPFIDPFIGVNHHRESVIFGGALLVDERTQSFVWLFETFLKAMFGKKPKTILTDQCPAMAKAISIVFPETQYRLCLWHIFQNAAKHLSHVYKIEGFKKQFNSCIYGCETEEEFLARWKNMLEEYDLVENEWLIKLFEDRHKWALVYARGTFCAGMTTTQRSESMNSFVKRKFSITEFLHRMERGLGRRRHTELMSDSDSIKSMPVLYAPASLLKQAATVYTHKVFYYFEDEYKENLVCKLELLAESEGIYEYKVTRERHKRRLVKFDSSNHYAECSCKMFEFAGVICRHIIRVFFQWNVQLIPDIYILKRWTKDAKCGLVIDLSGNAVHADCNADISLRYNDLCRLSVNFASKGAIDEDLQLMAKEILEEGMKKIR